MSSSASTGDVCRLRVEAVKPARAVWIITLDGEADIASLEQLESTLNGIQLDGTESVHMHMAGLEFCDVATLRELGLFARRVKRSGHELNVCGARPIIRKVARLLSLHEDLGIS